ncbi:E3 ubiquitin-protein ligase RNF149-like [Acipenser oxyrinchus oxyrinchus]|uniref:E3 ubiquitin-protein ligase RNF149-like n=1 Tax=Acipenser oxyrinchus oxyrinchus TaxID=40147 RepID=A0AAD8DHU7_ACIOX|nr:E3 ubiquitin-protein ligase RNF149-like [Acipenser oxyrinchus oxyrinchus]
MRAGLSCLFAPICPSMRTSATASSFLSWPHWRYCVTFLYLLQFQFQQLSCRSMEWHTAFVTTTYRDPATNVTVTENTESGRYGDSSPKDSVDGHVGIPRTVKDTEGCDPNAEYYLPTRAGSLTTEPWIALVARGNCTFKDKVLNAARKNAAAVVIYNEAKYGNTTIPMSHIGTGNTVVVMVGYPKGIEILELVRRGIPVKMSIAVGTRHVQEFLSGQSVVFVTIAFIAMMIISLAWLIFYYIQRYLYAGAQFGNQNNRKETKKAISQLQLHTVKRGDKEINLDAENCAVCIENYKPKDVVRILPCKHVFHRTCIDPWLLDHRTCPMCKLDVIKALGYLVDPEEAIEVTAPESLPDSVTIRSLSVSLQDDVDNEASSSSSPSHQTLQDDSGPVEEAGESVSLLDENQKCEDNREKTPDPDDITVIS